MKHKILFLALFALPFGLLATDQKIPLTVSPQWVKEHGQDKDLVILQVSSLRLDFDNGHIPGARFLWPEWLAPNTPDGAFNIPDPARARETLRNLGISKNSLIVLYHIRNDVSVTARMFLTLEQLGLAGRVAFMNGGLDGWKKAGFTLSKEQPVFKKGNFKPVYSNVVVDKDYVLRSLKSDTSVVVDARMKIFYDGDPVPANPRNGHIKGALNIPFTEMVDSLNAFKPLKELDNYFKPVAPDRKKEIVLYCFIGQTASVVYIAGRLLGYRMKLYDASLQEWTRREELPMELTKKQ